MTPEQPTKGTLIRYAIGASTLLLGLMAFSALCWYTCSICAAGSIFALLGFWELVAVGAVSFFAVTAIRSLQRRRRTSNLSTASTEYPPAATGAEDGVRMSLREKGANWRAMYAQLSRDEREKLKAMVGKYCVGEDGDAEITQPLSGTDDSRAHSH